jgi:hypothetical protein
VALSSRYYSAYLANVFHSIIEENQIHDSVSIIVFSKAFSKSLGKCFLVRELIIKFIIQTGNKVGKNKWLSGWTKELFDLSRVF